MTEDNLNDQHTEEQQSSDETQAELREISKEELKQILENHKKWLESDRNEGNKANFSGAKLHKSKFFEANLQWANFHKAVLYKPNFIKANLYLANLIDSSLQKAELWGSNLEMADFRRADLQKSNFNDTNLQGAIFHKANLQEAHFVEAKLHNADLSKADMRKTILDDVEGLNEANLQYANLQGATGLLGNEFAQADVTGTKLPDDIKEFKALETVKETSQNARKIFFAMLLGCVYSWLTIATTTDVRLLTNTASSPLPIIGTEIPIAWFYLAAPLVLICLYFYFHLYLDNLWEGLASLPAIFPDGKRLDQRAYPWLLNTLVRRHFKRLKNRPIIARMKEWITIFLAWWVVPLTMIAFWLRYIPRHDWFGTFFHIGLIVVSVTFSVVFYRLCALTLQGKEKVEFRLKTFRRDRRFFYGVSVFMVAILFSLLSYGAIEGVRSPDPLIKRNINYFSIKETIPWTFRKVGYDVFVDFREKSVSEKPDNYWQIEKGERLKSVKGAKLKEADLRNADLYRSFLVKADLRESLLNGANLDSANLHEANISLAKLQKAILVGANLQKAILVGAKLQKSNLEGVNLEEANLSEANLLEAYLRGANLQIASLQRAKLQEAYIGGANLKEAILEGANLQEAYLGGGNLKGAILSGANLKQTILGGADLKQADFKEANLEEANFNSADLTGAKNLTIEQLSKVKTLYKAKLDPELLEQVKKCCPHLLEKPKEETDKTN